MARRLYLGRLPSDARAEDVSKFFDGFGRIVDCRVMTGFGFVEFESSRDAEDAVHHFNGKSFMGANIVVEFAKESRPRRDRDTYEDRPPRSRRPPGFRVVVSGISRDTSWQDLKDFGREAGSVSFADIDRDHPGDGILEYITRDDAERAVKELDNRDLRGHSVHVRLDLDRPGPDNYRREGRRDDPRDDRMRDDRYARDDRYRDDRYDRDRYRDDRRREYRSRSPPRRSAPAAEFEDRRPPRSPPPPSSASRKEYDDRRGGGGGGGAGAPTGYDERRGGYDDRRAAPDPYIDRRRDEDRRRGGGDDRSSRRGDEKEDRYVDDRPPRHANGDGGWSGR